jgi:hypothetical protein
LAGRLRNDDGPGRFSASLTAVQTSQWRQAVQRQVRALPPPSWPSSRECRALVLGRHAPSTTALSTPNPDKLTLKDQRSSVV